MGHRSRRDRRTVFGAVLMAFTAILAITACDPGHPFADVQLKVQLASDGSATLSSEAETRAMADGAAALDPGTLSADLVARLHLGDVDGPPRVATAEFGYNSVGVDFVPTTPDTVTVNFDSLRQVLADVGVDVDAGAGGAGPDIFVSLCNAAGAGGATGNGVTIEANESCGTWLGPISEVPIDGSVTLRRATRPVASWLSIGRLVTVAVLTVVALLALMRLSPSHRRRWPARLLLIFVAVLLFGLGLWWARPADSWFAVGQNFEPAPRTMTYIADVVVLICIIGGAVQWVRYRRRVRSVGLG